MRIYRSDGSSFSDLSAAAASTGLARNVIARAIQYGYRRDGHWYGYAPFELTTIEGGSLASQRCNLVFSSDGRTWINATYAADQVERYVTAIRNAIRGRYRCAGLWWSSVSVEDAQRLGREAAINALTGRFCRRRTVLGRFAA